MQGSTHKTIGFAAGAGIVTYAVLTGHPLMSLGMITAPIGAMLPDIDHHNSKLGRTKDKVFKFVKYISRIVLIISSVLLVLSFFLGLFRAVGTICLSIKGVCILINIALSERLAKKFPFLTKHRGIMHTLLFPFIILVLSSISSYDVTKALVFGLAIGYLSHLYADSLTVEGCPLVWPISQECVGPRLCKTGSIFEYIFAALLSVFCVVYAILLSKDTGYIVLVFVTLIVPAFDVLTRMLCNKKSKKIKQWKIIKIILLIAMSAVCFVLVVIGNGALKVMAGSGLLGMLMGIINYYKEKD